MNILNMKEVKFILLCRNPQCKAVLNTYVRYDPKIEKIKPNIRDIIKEKMSYECPVCHQRYYLKDDIEEFMYEYIKKLSQKGYNMFRVIPEMLCIILEKGQLSYEQLCTMKLPHEFIIDISQPENDLILNDRMRDIHGFDNFNEEEIINYVKEANENLNKFIDELPTIEDVGNSNIINELFIFHEEEL